MALTQEEKKTLELQHRKERDGRIKDRIKAVLLYDDGWTHPHIAQALRVNQATIIAHLQDYNREKKLKPANGGSKSKLDATQTKELIAYLTLHTQPNVEPICQYVKKRYSISYSRQGMTCWLHEHGFSYKKAKGKPAKADIEKQEAFIKSYEELRESAGNAEPIIFMDASHPTMGTKLSCGWIRKGQEHYIATTASRTRVNITGGINIKTLALVSHTYARINSSSTIDFFKRIEAAYSRCRLIHVILDQAGYHKSKEVRAYLTKSRIRCHYLPPYSPNLNPIERLWKVLNRQVRNNRHFTTPAVFKEALGNFLTKTWVEISSQMQGCINDNFQRLPIVSST